MKREKSENGISIAVARPFTLCTMHVVQLRPKHYRIEPFKFGEMWILFSIKMVFIVVDVPLCSPLLPYTAIPAFCMNSAAQCAVSRHNVRIQLHLISVFLCSGASTQYTHGHAVVCHSYLDIFFSLFSTSHLIWCFFVVFIHRTFWRNSIRVLVS